MRRYLMIETRDGAQFRDVSDVVELALGICRSGTKATIFLAENGAFNVRSGSAWHVDEAIAGGVEVCVDGFALAERGISPDELSPGVTVGDVSLVVDHLAAGSIVCWR